MEYVKDNEIFYDYVLAKYSPIKETRNKLRISNILFKSFKENPKNQDFFNIVGKIRNEIGLNQTVWGIKNFEKNLKWEFYFYRHYNKNINLRNLIKIFNKYFKVEDLKIDENLNYVMFSFDIDENKIIKETHIYFEKFFLNSFQAWSYQLSSQNIEFENHYEFFNSVQYKDIVKKIMSSPFITSKINISQILYPELMECKSICIASKRNVNGVYFQGININQFLFFLKEFNYPTYLVEFIEKNQNLLDYILYDIGFDYSINNNKLFIKKSGFYGTF